MIKNNYDKLTRSEQVIADYVLSNSNKIAQYTIDELALQTFSSNATISRFVKKIGVDDYKTFRLYIVHDISYIKEFEHSKDASSMFYSINQSISELEQLKSLLNEEDIIICTHLLYKAKRVDFFGRGVSNLVAQDMQQKFIKVKPVTNSYVDASMQNTGASTLQKDDVALFFSYSGEEDVTKTMTIAKSRQAKVILITKYNSSSKAQMYADYTICLPVDDASDHKLYYTSSRITMLAIVDILYLNYINIYKESIDSLYRVETLAHIK
ncbi:MAG: MurR/RpiR family transcriptional regulator [Bacilli bacterium]